MRSPPNASRNTAVFPPGQTASNPIVKVSGAKDSLLVFPEKNWREFSLAGQHKDPQRVVVLNQRFDLDKGVIVEGHISARSATNSNQAHAGFYIEGAEKNTGTAIMLQVGEPQWRESKIGKLRTDVDFNFEALDIAGRNSATVTGLDNGADHTFRL